MSNVIVLELPEILVIIILSVITLDHISLSISFLSLKLSERMKIVDVLGVKTFQDGERIIMQVGDKCTRENKLE